MGWCCGASRSEGEARKIAPPPLLLVPLLAAGRADAWGTEGHIMVCKIAERYLTEKTAAVGGELSTMCPWADEMRFHYQWASLLHYANTSNLGNFKFSLCF